MSKLNFGLLPPLKLHPHHGVIFFAVAAVIEGADIADSFVSGAVGEGVVRYGSLDDCVGRQLPDILPAEAAAFFGAAGVTDQAGLVGAFCRAGEADADKPLAGRWSRGRRSGW